jgi:uncharacterized protein (DUF1778 family)
MAGKKKLDKKSQRIMHAEMRLLNQTKFVLSAKAFDALLEMLAAPPKANEKLRRLLTTKAPWEKAGD